MNEDFLDLLTALSAVEARYLVVGGYAVAMHGYPRATKDLDLWIEPTADNAARVIRALELFGAPLGDLSEEDLESPGTVFMMGRPPRRVDVINEIDGVRFADAWTRREHHAMGELRCPIIGLEDLIANKRASGRLQDLADVDVLERLAGARDP